MNPPTACTIVSNNYLPFARVWARSFLAHHPEGRAHVLLVDRPHPAVDPTSEPFTVTYAEDLDIPAFDNFSFRYSILELNTAVKPYYLCYLHEKTGCQNVCYFDPDILVTGDLSSLYALFDDADAVLTPHILEPIDDDRHPADQDFLLTGTFNLGFLGLAFNEETLRFLDWWQRRLHQACFHRIEKGLFVDQRWMDLAPSFLSRVKVLRDPGYNVAYWNVMHRSLSRRDDRWWVGDVPLRFFHFSGVDPRRIDDLSKYQDRFTLADRDDLRPLFEHYRERLLAEGFEDLVKVPYGYAAFQNGVVIPPVARRALHEEDPRGEEWPDPFAVPEGKPSFYAWLCEPLGEEGQPIRIPRLAHQLWRERPDLRSLFREPTGEDAVAFARWLLDHGRHENAVDAVFFEDLQSALDDSDTERQGFLRGELRYFDNGVEVPPRAFEVLAQVDPDGRRWPRPLVVRSLPSFYDWLCEIVELEGLPLPRIAVLVWEGRTDLRASFPALAGDDLERYAEWVLADGPRKEKLDTPFLAPVAEALHRAKARRLTTLLLAARGRGEDFAAAAADLDWLLADAEADFEHSASPGATPRIPRLALLVHETRDDLGRAFPDPLGESRRDFALWYATYGRFEYGLPARLVEEVLRGFPLRQRLSARVFSWRPRRPPAREEAVTPAPAAEPAPAEVPAAAPGDDLGDLHETWEGLAQTDPLWAILSEDDKRHGRWDLEEFFRTGRKEIAETLDALAGMGTVPDPAAALDFGCGAGRLTRALAGRFERAVGIDISETMVELARRYTEEENVTYVHNRRDDLGVFPDNSFTFVYTGRVLQHIRPELAKSYVRELFRVLAPGGVAVFQVPDVERGGDPSQSALPDEAYRAGLEVLAAPPELAAGANGEVLVRVTNTSPLPWPSVDDLGICQLRLANQWRTPEGALVVEDDARTALRTALAPGESRELKLFVAAPGEPGDYLCRIDVVQEFVAWFANKGSTAVEVAVRVTGERVAETASPHATIEMHTVAREEVERIVEEAGGELVEVTSDDLAGPEWVSLRYHAKKVHVPRPFYPQAPGIGTGLVRPAFERRPRSFEAFLATEVGTGEARRSIAPLNVFVRALWEGNAYVQEQFPLETERDLYCFAYWVALTNDRQLELQEWLLPRLDWSWFWRPTSGLTLDDEPPISHFLWFIRTLRRGLREAFPIDGKDGRRQLREWAEADVEKYYAHELTIIRKKVAEQEAAGTTSPPPVPVPRPAGGFEAGVNVIEHPLASLGIREDARVNRLALEAAGVATSSSSVFLADRDPGRVEREVRYRVNLLHVNADLTLQTFGQLGPQVFGGRFTIGYWLWELPSCPACWRSSLDVVDEVWVPSRFVHEAFAPGSPVPVVHMPYAVVAEADPTVTRGDFGLPEEAFLFLFTFDVSSFMARKNPAAVIEAFTRAFPKGDRGVGLVVKTAHADESSPAWQELLALAEDDPRILIVDEVLERDRLLGLVNVCDAYVSLHRSEGFGRGPAEAMLLGKPVVVTGYSGSTDYATDDTSCVVDYRLVPVGEGEYVRTEGQVWAEPDVDHAAWHMKRLVDDPARGRDLAAAGRRFVRAHYNPTVVGRRFAHRLRALGLL